MQTICPKCKVGFDLEKVEKEKFKLEGRQSMWLTYFDCPVCKQRIFVQLDNEETNAILNDLTKIVARVAKYKKSGFDIPKKLQSKYSKSTQKLNELRTELIKKYNNYWFECEKDKHTVKVMFYKV